MRIRSTALLPLALALTLGGCEQRERRETRHFAWQGDLSGERWIRVRNMNGPVKVVRSPDGRATIGVEVKGSRLRDLELLQQVDGDGLTACLVRDERDCNQRGRGSSAVKRILRRVLGVGDGSYSASYTIYAPADARVDIGTVNGGVTIESAAREFRVKTVNGAVNLTAIGESFHAESVNGSVTAAIDLVGPHGSIELSTVNGSVTAELPASLSADVSLKTVNGKVRSDFAMPVNSSGPLRALNGVIGGGIHRVSLKTVNGSATLKKRG